MTALARARETAATVRLHRAIGIAKRRRRIPRQRYPRTIELEYAKAILGVVAQARASLAPLLAALPRLIERAAAKRRIDDESSGGEGDETRRLIDQAREHMRQAIQPQALDDLARKFAGRTERDQGDQLKAQVRAGLGADVFLADRKLPALVDHFAAENVALIRGLPDDIAGQIEKLVTRALSSGTPHPELARQIEERFAVGESRARLIARDQIGKLYGQVNASRQQELGITHFVWRTVHDERVRPEHAALDGETFRYDDPPSEGLPGEAIACRCSADPLFESIAALTDDPDASIPEPTPRAPEPAEPVAPADAERFLGRITQQPLTPAQTQAIHEYQGGRYIAINEFARAGGELVEGSVFATKAEAKATQAALDGAIRKGALPRDAVLYRGIGMSREGITGELTPGGVIRDLGYSSTSIDRGVASEFAAGKPGATVLEIEAPRGTPAAFVPADGGLKEAEVLLPRGTRYEVISVRERDGVKIARVRIVR